mmetsp:Transcript_36449/g.104886  ORF Transcript_36449/g.104886 Transcript_36449/m.104886 type:complete len:267 (-) Transcript_36449:109-909(-)
MCSSTLCLPAARPLSSSLAVGALVGPALSSASIFSRSIALSDLKSSGDIPPSAVAVCMMACMRTQSSSDALARTVGALSPNGGTLRVRTFLRGGPSGNILVAECCLGPGKLPLGTLGTPAGVGDALEESGLSDSRKLGEPFANAALGDASARAIRPSNSPRRFCKARHPFCKLCFSLRKMLTSFTSCAFSCAFLWMSVLHFVRIWPPFTAKEATLRSTCLICRCMFSRGIRSSPALSSQTYEWYILRISCGHFRSSSPLFTMPYKS